MWLKSALFSNIYYYITIGSNVVEVCCPGGCVATPLLWRLVVNYRHCQYAVCKSCFVLGLLQREMLWHFHSFFWTPQKVIYCKRMHMLKILQRFRYFTWLLMLKWVWPILLQSSVFRTEILHRLPTIYNAWSTHSVSSDTTTFYRECEPTWNALITQ